VLAILFEDLGVSDTDIGNVGFAGLCAQIIGLLVVAVLADKFRSKIKVSYSLKEVLCFNFFYIEF